MSVIVLLRRYAFSIFSFLIVVPLLQTFAQYDNPNRDNTLGLIQPLPTNNPQSINIVTDAGGYDNFDLGVDFSEPHMVPNPRVPYQYFNAWNTNATHHTTTDGWTWSTQSPTFGTTMRGDPVTAYDSLGNSYYELM
jgi:hypothetical protein